MPILSGILQDFREYRSQWNNYIFLKRFNFKFRFYKKLADMSHKASGLKTRVVIVGEDRKIEIWNKRTIERYKKPIKRTRHVKFPDGSSKKITEKTPGRIPRHWGNLELNRITFYIADKVQLTPQEREEYRVKFNSYANRFLK